LCCDVLQASASNFKQLRWGAIRSEQHGNSMRLSGFVLPAGYLIPLSLTVMNEGDVPMSRVLFLGTLLFVGFFVSATGAQERNYLQAPFPAASNITMQWNYSCLSGQACSFNCQGAGNASSVTQLTIYLGSMPISTNQTSPAMFFAFTARDIPRGQGFSVSTGLGNLSCQVNGMTLDYAGPLK